MQDKANYERQYHWITAEAEELIAKAYNHHSALPMKEGDDRSFSGEYPSFPPSLGITDLEALSKTFHYEPKTWTDKIAKLAVDIMEKIMHLFFREKVGICLSLSLCLFVCLFAKHQLLIVLVV
jgi:hypothetical protein